MAEEILRGENTKFVTPGCSTSDRYMSREKSFTAARAEEKLDKSWVIPVGN